MKRDWEVIRLILLTLEKSPSANTVLLPEHIQDFPPQEVAYNMRLLNDAGYVEGFFSDSKRGDGAINFAKVSRMTIAGHELLDTIRNDSVWTKTKETFKTRGLDMTFELVKAVGKQLIESALSS